MGNVVNSCTADYSCTGLGYDGGTAGNIQNSCIAYKSCYFTGAVGVVGNIQNSCTVGYSCYDAGAFLGAVGNIQDSCTASNSCRRAGSNGGSIGSITSSCNALSACNDAGYTAALAVTTSLNSCCNTANSCTGILEATFQAALASVCPVRDMPCLYIMLLAPFIISNLLIIITRSPRLLRPPPQPPSQPVYPCQLLRSLLPWHPRRVPSS